MVDVKVKAEPEKAIAILEGLEGIATVHVDGNDIEVHIQGEIDDTSFILEALVAGGVKVVSINEREMDLEDIFMKITKGAVQ